FASGIVVASGRWGSDILTVAHAIDAALNIRVTIGNKQVAPARIVGRDTVRDIALVRTHKSNLPVAPLGASDDARSGATIGLLGYPIPDQFESEDLGLATSLSSGIISTIRREAIEVTLQIVPGESGGPIFLSDTGEIVGVAEARFEDEHSIGFAVPIDSAKRFLHKYDASHGF
ncbi:MAG TPA: serine protease, partial [Candidatus Rubrimentiphilum sp.]|nr:serine protease [Candidatus Rubrimentiphilum sp.]